jgi:prepilin-type N-terminal cleavage/methylation domain-containing protein
MEARVAHPPRRLRHEQGFSFVEILIVLCLLGILATIALPAVLGPQAKGADVEAKSNAHNVASAVESCFGETRSYAACDTAAELAAANANPGVALTDTTDKAKGAVAVAVDEADDAYTVVGYSKSSNTFSIVKASDGTYTRACTAAESGGCRTGSVW